MTFYEGDQHQILAISYSRTEILENIQEEDNNDYESIKKWDLPKQLEFFCLFFCLSDWEAWENMMPFQENSKIDFLKN